MRRSFPIMDVLSVTTGVLIGKDMGCVYQVLDHMEGYPHWTHGLSDAADRVTPEILRQHPGLVDVHPPMITIGLNAKPKVDKSQWGLWKRRVLTHHGSTIDLDGPGLESSNAG